MPQLFVPILVNDEIGKARHNSLFSVTGKTLENSSGSNSDINGYDESLSKFIPVLNKKLKNCFPNEFFSFNVYEYGKNPKDGVLENFTENTTSISLGILCSAYVAKKVRNLKEKYDSITVTGNFNVIDGRTFLSEVMDIEEKYKAVQDYASKNADKNHLFVYISSEETIPDGIQENNVHVIRYDGTFPAECVFAEVFEDTTIEKDATSFQKNRNEFIETRSFIKLKKDFVKNKSCNCCIIKGESNTGKSIAAEALCKYLVNSQLISGYAWFYIGDNARFIDLLSKERERLTKLDIETDFLKRNNEGNYIKETYPEVFETFDRLLQTDGRCAIIVDNIEYDIVDDVLSFFERNYPMGSNKYDLILTSWEGSRANQAASSINTWTIDISDIALDFKELKAIADGVIRINDYSKRYYESSENEQNELLELLFHLCIKYPGYILLVLAALNTNSIEEVLEFYRKEDIKDLRTTDKILKITFDQIDFLSEMVLFAYLQIKEFDEALKIDEIINILKERIFNNVPLIDKNNVRRSVNVLQKYSLLNEKTVDHYEIKSKVLNYAVFSKDLPSELSVARDLIISPERKVEYAIEEKKLEEFAFYIDKITEKETLNKTLIYLSKSGSPLEFFQILLTKDINPNYVYNNVNPLQICVRNTSNTEILDLLISEGADWTKNPGGTTLLHCAAMNSDSTMLKHILEHCYYNDINEVSNDGATPLHMACTNSKDVKSIELLLEYGANKDAKTKDGFTLLHCAAGNDDSTILEHILKHHYYDDINEPSNCGGTPLHTACANSKNIKSIKLLLKYGANKEARSKDGITPLHIICYNSKDTKPIELLLKYDANKDAKTNDGMTLLHIASLNDDSTVLRFILEHHYYTDIDEQDDKGRTPLQEACLFGKNTESIDLLLEYGADRQAKNNYYGSTMLHYAARNEDSTILHYILEHHYYTDIDEQDDKGLTPLHEACFCGKNTDSIELLLKFGADSQARANYGSTILHYAAENDDSTILRYILEHHYYTDIDETDNFGCPPLLSACSACTDTKSIELLLEYGADSQARSYAKLSMLHCALINKDNSILIKNKDSMILRFILEHHYYADINELVGDDERTVLFIARTLQSFKILLEHGADPEIITNKGNNILHSAVMNDCPEIVEYILENLPMVEPMLKNSDGKTSADLAKSDDIKKLFEKL